MSPIAGILVTGYERVEITFVSLVLDRKCDLDVLTWCDPFDIVPVLIIE
jgi:hypothetical protein